MRDLARWRADVRLRVLERRAPAPWRPSRGGWFALAASVLLLALLLRAVLPPAPRGAEPAALRVVLLDAEPAPVAEPPWPEPQPRLAHPAARVPAPPQQRAAPHDAATATDSPAPHVFNPDGSIDLPREPALRSDAMAARFDTPPRSADALRIMTHQRPLKVRPNHFAAAFRQPGTSALNDFVADNLTVTKAFTLPWGTHVECKGVGLGVAWLGACAWYTPYRYYVPQAPWRPASVLDEQ